MSVLYNNATKAKRERILKAKLCLYAYNTNYSEQEQLKLVHSP